jgi:hypothetical protein
MYKAKKNSETHFDGNTHRTTNGDKGDAHRTGDGTTDLREANENIRKSQGEDAGQRPTIDRHR